jgi:CRISPR/Cas system-associated endonuclease Cas3-HD
MEGIIDGKLNVNDYEMRDFQLMVEWLKAFSMKKNIAKGYIFLLAPLIVGDNLDSNEQRSVDEGSKAKSRFIKSLEEMENES